MVRTALIIDYQTEGYSINSLDLPNNNQYDPLNNREFKNIHLGTNNSGRGAVVDIIVNDIGRISSLNIINRGKGYKTGDQIILSKLDLDIDRDITIVLTIL